MIYFITHTNFYCNWGDVAIDLATHLFLSVHDLKYTTITQYSKRPNITSNDIVLIRGGGFFGLYNGEPEKFLMQYMNTQAKKTILLPSSLYFNNDNYSTIAKIKHLKLYIFARDDVSFDNYRKHFSNSIILKCPDMALFFDKDIDSPTNDRTVLIARGTEKRTNIEHYKYDKGTYVNHLPWKNVSPGEMLHRFAEFKVKFKEAKYIITDSLHCCIFSYLFNRYCYAFDNRTGKVFNTLRSYFDDSNIVFCTSNDDIKPTTFKSKTLCFSYDNLLNTIVN